MRFIILAIAVGLSVAVGCDTPPSEGAGTGGEALADSTGSEEAEVYDYTVYLAGALADTLQGDAEFGRVVKAGSRNERLLVKLETGGDFTGGFFISLGDSTLPAPGSYDLTAKEPADPKVQVSEPGIVYRKGLILNLISTAGTLTLDVVTDSLVQGSFNATLRGELRTPEVFTEQGEVNARGEFAARPGGVGFILGL